MGIIEITEIKDRAFEIAYKDTISVDGAAEEILARCKEILGDDYTFKKRDNHWQGDGMDVSQDRRGFTVVEYDHPDQKEGEEGKDFLDISVPDNGWASSRFRVSQSSRRREDYFFTLLHAELMEKYGLD